MNIYCYGNTTEQPYQHVIVVVVLGSQFSKEKHVDKLLVVFLKW